MKTRLFAALFITLAAAGEVRAAVRPEFSLALVQANSAMRTTYVHRYVPAFFDDALVSSSTEQIVDVSGKGIGTYSPCVALFLGKRLGVRLSTVGFEASVTGSTSPDVVSITYTARQPPDYVSREYSAVIEGKLPAPDGLLRTRAYSLDLIYRLVRPGLFAVDLSGGISLLRFDADLNTFGYRRFWFGGHSVLFSTLSSLRMETEAATRVGVNIGLTAAHHLSPAYALFVEARYVLGPKTDLPVRFTMMQMTEGYYPGPATLDGVAGAAPLTANPSFLTLSVGVRISPFKKDK